ncbi:MAG: DUF4416 family protein [Synergistaceae bacterium]|nr:DUF4416 family protein [Synergistaceae bacterium]
MDRIETDECFFYPVKLLAGVLYPDERLWVWTVDALAALWGEPEEVSEPFSFSNTDYYAEIAPVLYRRFLSFSGLRDGGELPEWKLASCAVEEKSRKPRAVNIDPGYVNGARLVLASTKDHAHRIYLGRGIQAEVTLRYRFRKWQPFDYTFPDFASGQYDSFLSRVRNRWINEMNTRRNTL